MKKTFFLSLLISLFLVSACSPGKTTLIVSASGSNDSLFFFFPPDRMSPDTLRVKGSEHQIIEFTNKEISKVQFIYAHSYVRLFVEPGHTYTLSFDASNENPKFTVDDKALQQYYNIESGRDLDSYNWIEDYSVLPFDTVGTRMKENFMALATRDKQLMESVKMSPALKKVFFNDTDLYWLTALSRVIRDNYVNYYRDDVPMYPGYKEVWDSIYKEHPINQDFLQSEWSYQYMQTYLFYELCAQDKKPDFKSQAEFWDYQYGIIYKNLTKKEIREPALAQFLFMDCLTNVTDDPALTAHLSKFMTEYPDNANNAFFKSYANDLQAR